jgi:hypothetical protein
MNSSVIKSVGIIALSLALLAPAKAGDTMTRGAVIIRDYVQLCGGSIPPNAWSEDQDILDGEIDTTRERIEYWSDWMKGMRARMGTDAWCSKAKDLLTNAHVQLDYPNYLDRSCSDLLGMIRAHQGDIQVQGLTTVWRQHCARCQDEKGNAIVCNGEGNN